MNSETSRSSGSTRLRPIVVGAVAIATISGAIVAYGSVERPYGIIFGCAALLFFVCAAYAIFGRRAVWFNIGFLAFVLAAAEAYYARPGPIVVEWDGDAFSPDDVLGYRPQPGVVRHLETSTTRSSTMSSTTSTGTGSGSPLPPAAGFRVSSSSAAPSRSVKAFRTRFSSLIASASFYPVSIVERRATPQEAPLASAVAEAARGFFEAAPQAAGLSIAVIHAGETRTYHFGTTELGRDRAPDDHTLYAIASITKTVIGSMLARAAVEERLSLDDDIRTYLEGSFPDLEYEGEPIRVAHLVNHVSGLPHTLPDRPEMRHTHPSYGGDPVPWTAYVADALEGYDRSDFLRDLGAVELEFEPGTQFSYSNAAAQVAGLVLEGVYGQPLESLVDSLIARPLGMTDTKFELDADERARLAVGYDEAGRPMPRDLTATGAAGGLMSTAADLARYVRWHLDETDPIVRRSHMSMAGDLRGAGPPLNWLVEESEAGLRRISSDGTVPGYHTRLLLYPELGLGVVVLTNQLDGSIPPLTYELALQVLESLDARAF
ncbi:MAG: beta-lactamase family protein [Gemmatimonadetes bacterium]|nr:beta-lactamase family protein [Gemmatimonadota bacterium]